MDNFNYKYILSTAVILAFICLSLHTADVYAENIIYPDNKDWSLFTMGGGNAVISGENPRKGNTPQSPGNGSLALSVNGVGTGDGVYYLGDWAFYSRYAGNAPTDSWGLLSDINAISFDWFRDPIGVNDKYGAPWLAQTPVLRLLIKDIGDNGVPYFSELVWEKYYTDPTPTTNGQWIEQNVIGDNLWRHIFTDNIGYTTSDGKNMADFSTNTLLAESVSSWASSVSDPDISLPYSSDAAVYGLSVGVGSYWPGKYKGYVDNVLLSFNGANGSTNLVIDDNFELPVPEPATLLLLGSGLALFAVRRKRHFNC